MPAMLGCSTICPNCRHQFSCCLPNPTCCSLRRSMHVLSGGGLVELPLSSSPLPSPQLSPSVPLTFVIPQFTTTAQQLCQSPNTITTTTTTTNTINTTTTVLAVDGRQETIAERLSATERALRQSGWYYEAITHERSNELLGATRVGTFLVRKSSDPRFLFSLSVQTDRGPTSVRLCHTRGYFRLDAQQHLHAIMPIFPNVVELVQYYVQKSKMSLNDAQVWVDPQGKWYSPILISEPLRMDRQPPKLKHLARMTVNKVLQSPSNVKCSTLPDIYKQLELPTSLTVYLAEYPYSI